MEEIFATLRNLQKKAGISVICVLASIIALVIVFSNFGAWGFIFVFCAAISVIFAAKYSKQYTKFYKENVVKAALSEVFSDLQFIPESGIDPDEVYGTKMMKRGDRFYSNDLIVGTYKGVGFRQSDVHITDESTDSDGNTTEVTVFKGRWMVFEFNKDFKYDIQVVSKRFYANKRKGGLFSKKEDKTTPVQFENEEFNSQFKVYAQNREEAFYIITPHIMESLILLRKGLNSPIMLMFVGGKLHIAVFNNKDAFEAKLFGKLDPETEKNTVLKDIRVITDFIDQMNMDRDIYKN